MTCKSSSHLRRKRGAIPGELGSEVRVSLQNRMILMVPMILMVQCQMTLTLITFWDHGLHLIYSKTCEPLIIQLHHTFWRSLLGVLSHDSEHLLMKWEGWWAINTLYRWGKWWWVVRQFCQGHSCGKWWPPGEQGLLTLSPVHSAPS